MSKLEIPPNREVRGPSPKARLNQVSYNRGHISGPRTHAPSCRQVARTKTSDHLLPGSPILRTRMCTPASEQDSCGSRGLRARQAWVLGGSAKSTRSQAWLAASQSPSWAAGTVHSRVRKLSVGSEPRVFPAQGKMPEAPRSEVSRVWKVDSGGGEGQGQGHLELRASLGAAGCVTQGSGVSGPLKWGCANPFSGKGPRQP